jgi:hypothetical protein
MSGIPLQSCSFLFRQRNSIALIKRPNQLLTRICLVPVEAPLLTRCLFLLPGPLFSRRLWNRVFTLTNDVLQRRLALRHSRANVCLSVHHHNASVIKCLVHFRMIRDGEITENGFAVHVGLPACCYVLAVKRFTD